jgi:hypothetical protein
MKRLPGLASVFTVVVAVVAAIFHDEFAAGFFLGLAILCAVWELGEKS